MVLVDSAGNVVAENSNQAVVTSNTVNYNPTFREDGFEYAIIDGEKLDDICDDREESAQ